MEHDSACLRRIQCVAAFTTSPTIFQPTGHLISQTFWLGGPALHRLFRPVALFILEVDVKELEMILAAVAQLGEAGKEAFIWWLVIDKGLSFLSIFSFFALIFIVVRMIISAQTSTNSMKQLRSILGVGSRGYLDDSECEAIVAQVIKLKAGK